MDIEQSVLPSGLRVITSRLPGFQSAAVVVFVNTGSRSEGEENGGTAHFLEHLAFKGTATRSALQIATEIECLGAHINAFTSKDMTAFYVSGLNRAVPDAVAILGDVLTASRFADDDIALERQVVLQEIKQYQDNPNSVASQALWRTAFPDQALGRPILGSADFISRIARADVADFVGRHYHAGNMVVVGTGEIDHAAFRDMVAERFAALPSEGTPQPFAPARYAGGVTRADSERFQQVSLLLALPTVSDADPRSNAFSLLSSALGGGMSSPLFQEVREKRGLAYAVSAFGDRGDDYGMLMVHAGTTKEHVPDLLQVIGDALQQATQRVADLDFTRARNQALARLATVIESPFRVARTIAWSLFTHGRVITPTELMADVEAVTPDDVMQAARDAIAGPPCLSLVGPVQDADYGQMLQNALG